MLDIRLVLGVVVILFGIAAFFSEGDHSINLLEKFDQAQS